ncbi:MAG TPA: glycosyltransferase [Candidatus Sulfotelmatobacter sp.]|nr:glycosyltransferase [Candidatus Sulfotelmatobacter sp.]
MRLLFVTYRFPVYPGCASSNTVFNLLKYFSRSHEVFLAGLSRGPVSETQRETLRPYCRRMEIVEWPNYRGAANAVRGLASSEPLQMWYFRSASLAGRVKRIIDEEKIDLAYGYHLRSSQYLAAIDSIPSVVALQPAQILHFGRRCQLTRNPALRAVYSLEHRRLIGYEAEVAQKFDSCLLISTKDRQAIDPENRLRNVFLNPHGTDTGFFAPPVRAVHDENTVVFCGSMAMDTNVDAVLHFRRNILPLIWQQRPATRFVIVGRNPARQILKLTDDPRIQVTGFVEDVRPYLWNASVGVDPIRMAAGMQNKVIEGLAAGLPMVISPEANEGIGAPEGSILIGRTTDEFAAHVVALLKDRSRAAALAKQGLAFVQKQWSWEHHFRRLETLFDALVSQRACATA